MWACTLVVIVALSGSASAEFDASPPRDLEPVAQTPLLRIGQPGAKLAIDKIIVAIQRDALGASANVTLMVTTTDIAAREAVMALEIPRGARVTGVALTIGKTERMVALASGADRARTDYQRLREWGKDPILVQWKHEALDTNVLDVRAFPLTKAEPGRIELTIELPEISRLSIDATAKTIEIVDGATTTTHRKVKEPITIDMPMLPRFELAATPPVVARPHVSPTTSFYVGFPGGGTVPTITFGGRPHFRVQSPDKGEIRREIKRHIARLGRCYEKAVEFKGGPEGTAVLHFTIDTAGKIASVNIDGTLDNAEITSCLTAVVQQFEFRAGDSATEVNYPLSFRLAGS